MNLKTKIREVKNWPIRGVNFKDITPLFQERKIFNYVIKQMVLPYKGVRVDKVVAVDARGFLLATPIAYKLGCGVAIVRKKGKLPYITIEEKYKKEYGFDVLTMHKDAVKRGERVVIVDDLMATGGTIRAATKLVEKLRGKVIGISCIIDLPFLKGSYKLKKYPLHFLTSYEKE